jgi:lipoyl-dependent peroxiredoxin
VPRIERSARAVWEGSSAKGSGTLTADTGAFAALAISEPTRVSDPHGQTSPEELLAAAHAGCLAMSVAAELTRAKAPPERLEVYVTVRMDERDGSHEIVGSTADVAARAAIDREGLDRAVADGHAGCPFSRLLERSGAEVQVNATLEEG